MVLKVPVVNTFSEKVSVTETVSSFLYVLSSQRYINIYILFCTTYLKISINTHVLQHIYHFINYAYLQGFKRFRGHRRCPDVIKRYYTHAFRKINKLTCRNPFIFTYFFALPATHMLQNKHIHTLK